MNARLARSLLCLFLSIPVLASEPAGRIRVDPDHPRFWNYRGETILLLGGSVEDNLFQIPNLTEQLDQLQAVGGNYVRCTMSCRDEGDVWPFAKAGERYDLDRWNEEFWNRFERFLRLTAEREIVVQIELWATFDYYRDLWDRNPFNPKNNLNYTAKETGLPTIVKTHPTRTENNFFWSIPAERNQAVVLKYQRRFVDRILRHSLPYGQVLYCMDNETSVTPEWGWYWAKYIRARAEAAGVNIETTEMWDPWDLAHAMHGATFEHPEVFTFVDISQNNHQKGQNHWDNAQKQRARISANPRPLNNIKIYGADTGRFGNTRDGMERFWRNILGGLASARFHRPDSGLGLSDLAQANIRGLRSLTDRLRVFECVPHNDLLSDREPNEAYCLARPGREYAVYFPRRGEVTLDLKGVRSPARIQWLRILTGAWNSPRSVENVRKLTLSTPSDDYWAALIQTDR